MEQTVLKRKYLIIALMWMCLSLPLSWKESGAWAKRWATSSHPEHPTQWGCRWSCKPTDVCRHSCAEMWVLTLRSHWTLGLATANPLQKHKLSYFFFFLCHTIITLNTPSKKRGRHLNPITIKNSTETVTWLHWITEPTFVWQYKGHFSCTSLCPVSRPRSAATVPVCFHSLQCLMACSPTPTSGGWASLMSLLQPLYQ